MQLFRLKLVTIVAEEALKAQLKEKVLELGATGCTYHPVEGVGSRSSRHNDMFNQNFQMKIVCSEAVANTILTYISHNYFEDWAIVAWVVDAEVVRGSHYMKP